MTSARSARHTSRNAGRPAGAEGAAGDGGASGRDRAPRVPFALLVTVLVVGGLALLLALNTASAANELRRSSLAERDSRIADQVQQLQIDVAASAADGNIASQAAQLGMVPAGDPAYLVVQSDGSVRVMGRAKAASAAPIQAAPPTRPTAPKAAPSGSPSPNSKSSGATASGTTSPNSKSSGATASGTRSSGATTRSNGTTTGTASSSARPPSRPTSAPPSTPVFSLPGGDK